MKNNNSAIECLRLVSKYYHDLSEVPKYNIVKKFILNRKIKSIIKDFYSRNIFEQISVIATSLKSFDLFSLDKELYSIISIRHNYIEFYMIKDNKYNISSREGVIIYNIYTSNFYINIEPLLKNHKSDNGYSLQYSKSSQSNKVLTKLWERDVLDFLYNISKELFIQIVKINNNFIYNES